MLIPDYNPDVLTCLANLSSDEVFTPPKLANEILDLFPSELWSDETARFLDPGCKSGVFLREIAKRLDQGLEHKIPDRQERINHICRNQLFALAITELTALLARRSVYCSKKANGEYSVCDAFDEPEGNIRFIDSEHTWENGKCIFCGVSEKSYSDLEHGERHAYSFIHTKNPEDLFNMKFDVIIGNPPYQLSDGGHGRSASPIYQHFVKQAMKLAPRYLSMIIPSRWMGGGKGLNEFRSEMLSDKGIRVLVDFERATDVFPGVDIAGGICYFLWSRDEKGICQVTSVTGSKETKASRELDEYSVFIRDSRSVEIVRKVSSEASSFMSEQVSPSKPFGLRTFVRPQESGDLTLRWQHGEGPYSKSDISVGVELIDKWKVITSYVGYDHAGNPGKDGKRRVFSKIDILGPQVICTETYLVVGAYETQEECHNLIAYMKTIFFRFLVSQFMYSHHITRNAYSLVPVLDMREVWSDSALAKRFKLSKADREFMASKIREMD